jgi:hypothetical protein
MTDLASKTINYYDTTREPTEISNNIESKNIAVFSLSTIDL